MLIEVCAFVLAVNEVIECVTGAGAQNSGDSDHCDWVAVEPGCSVTDVANVAFEGHSEAVFEMAYLLTAYCLLPSTQCTLPTIF